VSQQGTISFSEELTMGATVPDKSIKLENINVGLKYLQIIEITS